MREVFLIHVGVGKYGHHHDQSQQKQTHDLKVFFTFGVDGCDEFADEGVDPEVASGSAADSLGIHSFRQGKDAGAEDVVVGGGEGQLHFGRIFLFLDLFQGETEILFRAGGSVFD